jgi:hypothetical protein
MHNVGHLIYFVSNMANKLKSANFCDGAKKPKKHGENKELFKI